MKQYIITEETFERLLKILNRYSTSEDGEYNNDDVIKIEEELLEEIEKIDFVSSDNKTYPAWITKNKVYVENSNHWPNFKWLDEFNEDYCTVVSYIPTTNIRGFYRDRHIDLLKDK